MARVFRIGRVALAATISLALAAGCAGGGVAPRVGAPSNKPRGAGGTPPVGPVATAAPREPGAGTPPPGSTTGGLAPTSGPLPLGPVTVRPAADSPWALTAADSVLTGVVRGPIPLLASNGSKLISDQGGTVVANNGGNVIANNGGNVIANNGGNVIANNGGNVIANNGGNVVSNGGASSVGSGGGRYRLRAVEEARAANFVVRLVDAEWHPLLDEAGRPVEALTGMDGRFTFQGVKLRRNALVVVELPEGRGQLSSFAIRGDAPRQEADIDLAATIATSYVLDRFVAPQADRAVTFDKLPAGEALAAKEQAARAFQLKDRALPVRLDVAAAVALGETLRGEDPGFDRQMETIRELLVPGGQRGLGEGLPADQVALAPITDVAVGPDGARYLACKADSRVWRIGGDGKLRTAIGVGANMPTLDVEGKLATEVDVDRIEAIAVSQDNGLHLIECRNELVRLLSIGQDGRVAVRWSRPLTSRDFDMRFALVRATDGLIVVEIPVVGEARAWKVPAGGAPFVAHTFGGQASAILRGASRITGDGRGRAAIATAFVITGDGGAKDDRSVEGAAWSLDLASWAIAPLLAEDPAKHRGVSVDDRGRAVALLKDGRLEVGVPPERTFQASALPGSLAGEPIASLGDDAVIVTSSDQTYRVDQSGVRRDAGVAEPPLSIAAARLPLREPIAFAADGDGRQAIYDSKARIVWRIDLDGMARRGPTLPPRLGAEAFEPTSLRLAGGTVWLIDSDLFDTRPRRLARLEADGTPREVLRSEGEEDFVMDIAPQAGGGLLVLMKDDTDFNPDYRMIVLDAEGRKVATHELPSVEARRMAATPGGEVYLAGETGLWRWRADGRPEGLVVPSTWYTLWDDDTWLSADAQGRLYGTYSVVWRFDPTRGVIEELRADGQTVDSRVSAFAAYPFVDAAGNLFFLERVFRQVRLLTPGEQRWAPEK